MLPFQHTPQFFIYPPYFWYTQQQQWAQQYRPLYNFHNSQPWMAMNSYDQYKSSDHGQNVSLDQVQPSISNQPVPQQQQIKPVEISKTYNDQHHSLKSLQKNRPKRKTKLQRRTFNTGHWTKKVHRLYLAFIEKYRDVFLDANLKKQEKVFKQMSFAIKTRSPSQCRSHHQKFDPLEVQTQHSQHDLSPHC